MGHHVERVQEAAVVEDPSVHVVRHRVVLHPAERQGHVGARTLQAGGQPAGRTGETGETDGGEISEHVVSFYSLREHLRHLLQVLKKAPAVSLVHPSEQPCAESWTPRHGSGESGGGEEAQAESQSGGLYRVKSCAEALAGLLRNASFPRESLQPATSAAVQKR